MSVFQRITQLLPDWTGKQIIPGQPSLAPKDLVVEDAGASFVADRDELDYLWYKITELEDGQRYAGYRVVRLQQLKYIPLEARSDAGLVQKMRTVLRGASGASVNLVYLTAGIYEDPPLGIVQCYGVVSFGETLQMAVDRSQRDLNSLEAGLRGVYRQIRLEPLSIRVGNWIYTSLGNMPYALIAVGHPDPRETVRGGKPGMSNPLTMGDITAQQMNAQQNEIVFRGMSTLREEFVFQVIAHHIPIATVCSLLAGFAEETSIWASQQTGMRSASFGISLPALLSGGMAESAMHGYNSSEGTSETTGTAHTDGTANSTSQSHTEGTATTRGWTHSVTDGTTITDGTASSVGSAETHGTAETQGSAHTEGETSGHTSSRGWSDSLGVNVSTSRNVGLSGGIVVADVNAGASATIGASYSHSWTGMEADMSGSSSSDTTSQSSTISQGTTSSASVTNSHSVSQSHSVTNSTSEAHTVSESDTVGQSQTTSASDTVTVATGRSSSQGFSTGTGRAVSNGLSVGLAPSFSIGNSAQWQNDPAMIVTELMRVQQQLLKVASAEGAYYTDVYALTRTERGQQALLGLIPEAFQGLQEVVTGVQCRTLMPEEQEYIRLHARTFTPSTRKAKVGTNVTAYMDSTLLTMLQLAAYVSPGTFEESTAVTVQEETPAFAYYPDMPGDVILGRQYSTESGQLTKAQLRLTAERHFHTAFVGDTGFGKTVAAETLALETTLKWHYRTVVLDFGQGWRKALRWRGMNGHVDLYQLHPGGQRPLRWNILQVPKRIMPGRYRTLVAELFANAGQMGPRQLGFLRRALTEVYNKAGVLIGEEESKGQEFVRAEESKALGLKAGIRVQSLPAEDQQRLAMYRSRQVTVLDWLKVLRSYFGQMKNDQASRTSLEGVLLRLEQFEDPQMINQYGSGMGLEVENLGLLGDGWGATIIEGGAEMDEYPKAALLSLLATILYFDAVTRRREGLSGKQFPPLQIFFEEANKVLCGVSSGGSASDTQSGGGNQVSAIFQSMWRDGRKYRIFLHMMGQTVSELPEGILASCANLFVFQTKNPKDRDLILPHLGRSEKGVVNTEYKRYLARIPRGTAIAKLGYSDDVTMIEPVLIRPNFEIAVEPSDEEIEKMLGGIVVVPAIEAG